jgi:hypothetical protein
MMYFREVPRTLLTACLFVLFIVSSEELFKLYVLVLKFKDRVGDKMWDVGDAHTVSHCYRPCACTAYQASKEGGLSRHAGSIPPGLWQAQSLTPPNVCLVLCPAQVRRLLPDLRTARGQRAYIGGAHILSLLLFAIHLEASDRLCIHV